MCRFILIASLFVFVTGEYVCPQPCSCQISDIRLFINCAGKGLTNIPVIPSTSFDYPGKRVSVDLSINRISEVPSAAFEHLDTLVSLSLSANEIAQFSSGWSANISDTLTKLYINDNQLTGSNTQDVVANLTHLKHLHMKGNPLGKLEFLVSFPSLVYLRADNCSLKSIGEDDLQGLPALNQLSLDDNSITNIHPNAFNVSKDQLTHLTLNGNLLTDIRFISHLTNLREIQIENNFVEDISELISLASSLEYLYISENPIRNISKGLLQKLEKLKKIWANDCQLKIIPILNQTAPISNTLESLSLSNNNMPVLSEQICYFRNLVYLDVSGNDVTGGGFPSCFRDPTLLTNLHVFDLSYNQLIYTPRKILQMHPSLHHLNVSHNRLTWIGSNTTISNTQLAVLDLSHNLIDNVGPNALNGIPDGIQIYLDYNLIDRLYYDFFPYTSVKNVMLSFTNNPHNCDCYGRWLLYVNGEIKPPRCINDKTVTILSRSYWPCFTTEYLTTQSVRISSTTAQPAVLATTQSAVSTTTKSTVSTTIQSIVSGMTQPIVSAATQAAISAAATQAAVSAAATQSAVSAAATQSAVSAAATQSAVSAGTTQSAISVETTQHVVSARTTQPAVSAGTTQPTVSAGTTQPTIYAGTTQPTIPAETTQSVIAATTRLTTSTTTWLTASATTRSTASATTRSAASATTQSAASATTQSVAFSTTQSATSAPTQLATFQSATTKSAASTTTQSGALQSATTKSAASTTTQSANSTTIQSAASATIQSAASATSPLTASTKIQSTVSTMILSPITAMTQSTVSRTRSTTFSIPASIFEQTTHQYSLPNRNTKVAPTRPGFSTIIQMEIPFSSTRNAVSERGDDTIQPSIQNRSVSHTATSTTPMEPNQKPIKDDPGNGSFVKIPSEILLITILLNVLLFEYLRC